jgi:hypothetical protein
MNKLNAFLTRKRTEKMEKRTRKKKKVNVVSKP